MTPLFRDMKGGWSGARLIETPYGVLKMSTDPVQAPRIDSQAAFFAAFPSKVTPVLLASGRGWYLIPKYEPLGNALTHLETTEALLDALSIVWASGPPPVNDFHSEWIHRLAAHYRHLQSSGFVPIDILKYNLSRGSSPIVVTHGDPTFDNVMINPHVATVGASEQRMQFTLIDPLPWGVVPPLRAVDLGKVLQSCILSSEERIVWYPQSAARVLRDLDWKEARMCWDFCALHLTRIIPYRPNLAPSLMKCVTAILTWHDPLKEMQSYVERNP